MQCSFRFIASHGAGLGFLVVEQHGSFVVVLPVMAHFDDVDLFDKRERREVFSKIVPVHHVEDLFVPALFLHNVILEWACCFFESEDAMDICSDNFTVDLKHNVISFVWSSFDGGHMHQHACDGK